MDSWQMILDFVPVAKQRIQDTTSEERLLLAYEVHEFFNCLELGAGKTDETGNTLFSTLLYRYLEPVVEFSADTSPDDLCLLGLLLEAKPIHLVCSIDAYGNNPLHTCVQWIVRAVSASELPYRACLQKDLFASGFPCYQASHRSWM